jgi:hypothetical protein
MFTSQEAHIDSPIYPSPIGGQNLDEHPHRCSVCDPAHYTQLKKSQQMPVWLRKMVSEFAEAGKSHSKDVHLQRRV